MIYNDPMLRKAKPVGPVIPPKPDKPIVVTNDVVMQQANEMMFMEGRGWLAADPPQLHYQYPFYLQDERSSTGAVIPSDMYPPWVNYNSYYGNVTVTLQNNYGNFYDKQPWTFYPFIVGLGQPIFDGAAHRAYLHNLLSTSFLGANTVADLASNIYGFNKGAYTCMPWAVFTYIDDEGYANHIPFGATETRNGDTRQLNFVFTKDVLELLSDYGCEGIFGEGHVGYPILSGT